jgi:hypothetical protein
LIASQSTPPHRINSVMTRKLSILPMLLIIIIALCFSHISVLSTDGSSYETEEIFNPNDCEKIAQPGDHLLIEYSMVFENQTTFASVAAPDPHFHILLDFSDELPIHAQLKGMCQNASKKLIWSVGSNAQLLPLESFNMEEVTEQVSVTMTVAHITTAEEYQIFEPLREGNITRVFELIDNSLGTNAVDEFGETPLLIAVKRKMDFVLSYLLNARMPRPNINFAKPSGYTALVYAISNPSEFVTNALLRRGADPNILIIQPGSKGNTPLHFACLQEKQKHSELLLQYGANPYAVNEFGAQPLQLVPKDASRQTRLFFRKIFDEAASAMSNRIEEDYHEPRKEEL